MTTAITDADVLTFTEGSCYQLAAAIREATGWPMYAFWNQRDQQFDDHAFVKTPNGKFLDVKGEHTRKEMHNDWTPNRIKKVPKCYDLSEWDDLNPYFDSMDRAREIVPQVLAMCK